MNQKNVVKSYRMFDNELNGTIQIIMDFIEGTEVLDKNAEHPTEEGAKS